MKTKQNQVPIRRADHDMVRRDNCGRLADTPEYMPLPLYSTPTGATTEHLSWLLPGHHLLSKTQLASGEEVAS